MTLKNAAATVEFLATSIVPHADIVAAFDECPSAWTREVETEYREMTGQTDFDASAAIAYVASIREVTA